MKKKIIILLLFLTISAGFSRSFSLEKADVKVNVMNNGLVRVSEEVTFKFNGCYSVIYKEVPLGEESEIVNFTGTSDEVFTPSKAIDYGYYIYEFQFNDLQCDKNVTVLTEYDMINVIDVYDDVSSLHFQFWGAQWDLVKELNAEVRVPGNISEYWIHNEVFGNEYETNKGVLEYHAFNVPSEHWIEVQALFSPLSAGEYVDVHTGTYADEIREQEFYYSLFQGLQVLFTILMIAVPFLLFLKVYNEYGREEVVNYMGIYERNPPTSDSPAKVNALLNVYYGALPSIDAFIATIFELARRKVLKIKGDKKNIIIKIEKKDEVLEGYEEVAFEFLKDYADANDEILWDSLKKRLKKYKDSNKFYKTFNSFKKKVKDSFNKQDYYNSKGNFEYIKLTIISLVLLSLFNFVFATLSASFGIFLSLFPSLIISFIIFFIMNLVGIRILGKWTRKGRNFELKWNNFKKYLKDYSELKNHPPQSLIIWEQFLVYAISLGVADNVIKLMKLSVPDFQKKSSFGVLYYHPAFYTSMRSTMYTSSMGGSSSRGGSSFGGGGGGFGGGFGGGGGGAR